MPRLSRRALAALALSVTALPRPALAQGTPLRLVLDIGPQDPLLAVLRPVTGPLAARLGRPVELVPATGEGGLVAARRVLEAPADGNTLLLATSALLSAGPFVRGAGLPFRPHEVFAPVGRIAFQPLVAVVGAQGRFRDADQLAAAERSQPGTVRYGTAGEGSPSHLFFARAARERGLERPAAGVRHHQGATALVTAIAAGEVDKGYVVIAAALPGIRAGRLRPLYVATRDRVVWVPELEAVPSLTEAVPGWTLDAMPWFGLVARAGTPAAALAPIAAGLARVLDADPTRAPLMRFGLLPNPDATPEDFARFWEADIAMQRDFARAAGFTG